MNNATWAEIVWTIGAFIGLNCNLGLLRVAVLDIVRLKRRKLNGPRTVVARGNRRNEVFRVFSQAALLYFGWSAMVTPPSASHNFTLVIQTADRWIPFYVKPIPVSPTVSALGIQLTVVLVIVEVLLVVGAVLDLRERRELIRQVDLLEERRETHRISDEKGQTNDSH